jgi:hypothetical protein
MRMYPLLLAGLVLLSGCSAKQDVETAQTEVGRFHKMFDAGQYAEIYAMSGPEIRQDKSEVEWNAMLAGVHNLYGNVTEAKSVGFNVNYSTGGSRVSLVYDTKFAHANGREEFVYDLEGKKVTLAGWNIKPSGS